MSKKIMKSLLVLFLAVSLTACGKTSQANNVTQDTIVYESAENTQAETDTTNEETAVETPEPDVQEKTKETEAPKTENGESTPAPTASPEPTATSKPEATAKPTTTPTETPKETATPKPTATPKATEAPKNTGNNGGNNGTNTGNGGTASATPTPALAHTCTFDAGVVTTAATCGKEGVKTFTCTQCGKTKTETIPATGKHNYVKHEWSTEPICVRGGVYFWNCSCGAGWTEQVPATGIHTDDGGVLTSAATCGLDGQITHHCSVCGVLMYEEPIPATGSHNWVRESRQAYYPESKEILHEEYDSCTNCGATQNFTEWFEDVE